LPCQGAVIHCFHSINYQRYQKISKLTSLQAGLNSYLSASHYLIFLFVLPCYIIP
jgi:hypothetical protein